MTEGVWEAEREVAVDVDAWAGMGDGTARGVRFGRLDCIGCQRVRI